jgi:hypothetical protein
VRSVGFSARRVASLFTLYACSPRWCLQVLTPLHLTLELDSGAGPLVETFTASYMAPGQSFSVLGSLHIFENAIAFHGTSAVLGTSTWKIELSKINQLRQISVMVRARSHPLFKFRSSDLIEISIS